ncbi:NAD(P)-dependent oxidoreductase [Pseudopedobacter beijingensis]|uniref:NAD(P)-dependent oxidoreductase n=1 Tax=Pseudopedobacter beijingensis TaxID=1207056 RepID=A0ABW4ICZ0_9SPHI
MRILITAPYNETGREELERNFGEIVYKPWKNIGRAYNEEELLALLSESGAEALITEHDHVTGKVISANPQLAFIGVCRGTPSNVALETAKQLNIPVFHTPARNAQAVAEMFIANVINLYRKTIESSIWLKSRKWDEGAHTSYLEFKGLELAGKTIGMVGFGAVGQTIANLVKNFPVKIKFYDPFLDNYDPEYEKTSLEDVFASSDIVSIHLPVNANTERMIDEKLISLMKPTAIFVNTARAVVVKREDLIDALENNKIKGAILDVFDHEPPDALDYKLIDMPNVLATPHTAGATFEVEDHHVVILNKQLLAWVKQKQTTILSNH